MKYMYYILCTHYVVDKKIKLILVVDQVLNVFHRPMVLMHDPILPDLAPFEEATVKSLYF